MGILGWLSDPMKTGASKGKIPKGGTGATVKIPKGGTKASYRAALKGRRVLRGMDTGSGPKSDINYRNNLAKALKGLEKANDSGDIKKINTAHKKLKKYLPH
jgi:hypothetical protein